MSHRCRRIRTARSEARRATSRRARLPGRDAPETAVWCAVGPRDDEHGGDRRGDRQRDDERAAPREAAAAARVRRLRSDGRARAARRARRCAAPATLRRDHAATWSASSSFLSARFRRVVQLVGEMPSTRAAVVGVEVEHDAQRDDLALAGREARRAPPRGRARGLRRSARRSARAGRRAARAACGGARSGSGRARPCARPGRARSRRAARGVEAVPEPQRALERGSPVRSSAAPRSPVNQAR